MRARVPFVLGGAAVLAIAGCTSLGGSRDDALGMVHAGDGTPDATAPCTTGTVCGGACVDLRNDDANCGACGTKCGAGTACKAGQCVLTCGAKLTACGGACVDVQSDDANCGGCGNPCGAGTACVGGQCATLCGSATNTAIVLCGGVCTDTSYDPNNCGGCGKKCNGANATNTTCGGGQCGVICAAGFADCNGDPSDGCEENLTTSTANCGGCGQACTVGACSAGQCPPDPEWASGPASPDSPDAAAYVVEHGGALFDVDGGVIDAALSTIADASIDAGANGQDVDASACVVDGGGALTVNTSACDEAGTCDDVVFDQSTGLLWQRFSSATSNSLAEAQCYCATLQIAGLTGWRLPTRLELLSLVDFARANPATHPGAFPTPTSGNFLTSSVSKPVDPAPYSYEIDFGTGQLQEWGAGGGGGQQSIRCVR